MTEEYALSRYEEACALLPGRLRTAAMAEELFVLADALGGDVTAWVEAYRRQCVNLGKPVRLLWTEGQTEAVAEDIDEQFGLTVRLPDGSRQTVRTGEVSVRGLYGYV